MKSAECIVVGGGVIGLSLAWELSKQGVDVLVIDRDSAARGTSWAGVGILPPANESTAVDPIERLRARSHRLHREWSTELLEATGIDNGYRRCGGIYLAVSPGERAALVGLAGYWNEYDIHADPLTEKDLAHLEPNLARLNSRGAAASAWLLPDEAQIRSPNHLNALKAACESQSVRFAEGTAIRDIEVEGNRITCLRTDADSCVADFFCLAGGAWSGSLLLSLHLDAGIIPVRGQISLYRFPQPPVSCIVNEGNRYLVARDDGHLLVGSNEEEAGFDLATRPEITGALHEWATDHLPLLKGVAPVKTWSGLRPASYDGFPYIGRVPSVENGFVATGHFRSGLHLSCATAVELAAIMLGRVPSVDMSYFSPGRDYVRSQQMQHDRTDQHDFTIR